jgi:hypothetical protein
MEVSRMPPDFYRLARPNIVRMIMQMTTPNQKAALLRLSGNARTGMLTPAYRLPTTGR